MMRTRFTVELEGDYEWQRRDDQSCEQSLRGKVREIGSAVEYVLHDYYPLLRVSGVSFANVEYDDAKVQS